MVTIKIKIDRHGNVISIVGNVGQTRMNRVANELWRGNIQPTFCYKLRRFIRRLCKTFNAWCEDCAMIANNKKKIAEEVPVIGMLEEHAQL